jgi:hypothetical protein
MLNEAQGPPYLVSDIDVFYRCLAVAVFSRSEESIDKENGDALQLMKLTR